IAVSILLAVLILLAGGFFWYVSDYYQAEDVALEVLASGDHLEVRDDLTILSLSYPTDTAIIFYPGAKVEAAAYLPLLNQLRQTGLTCILVEMPFHLAIFDVNAAEDVMAQFPDIQHWYIAGHSMGGAMASQFASEYPDEVDGLLLLGAYLYGDYPPADTLTVYGSLNQSVEDKIDYTENVVEIEGGNHAQFGNYGPQKGDLPATISAEEQQAQTVEAISDLSHDIRKQWYDDNGILNIRILDFLLDGAFAPFEHNSGRGSYLGRYDPLPLFEAACPSIPTSSSHTTWLPGAGSPGAAGDGPVVWSRRDGTSCTSRSFSEFW
ncbi:MAG: alpha/beta fold hydrolase, partial [Flavonifractor plautii]